MKKYVNYGCGLCAPKEWENYDISLSLRIKKVPILGTLLNGFLPADFPIHIKYGDIKKGLSVQDNSCDGVYCSHILEHLNLEDFCISIENTYNMLKQGGIFRCVVPDLGVLINAYTESKKANDVNASYQLLRDTALGQERSPNGFKEKFISKFGFHHHLWMWDEASLINELEKAGFKNIKRVKFNDSEDTMFKLVEVESRFIGCLAVEGYK